MPATRQRPRRRGRPHPSLWDTFSRTPGKARRYCSDRCATRTGAAAHRARRRRVEQGVMPRA